MRLRFIAIVAVMAVLAASCGGDGAPLTTPTEPALTTTTTSPPAASDTGGIATEPEPEPEVVEPLGELRILHPKTLAFAAPFAVLGTDGGLGEVVSEVTTEAWTTPDVLRTVLVNGDTEVAAVPTYVGANLYNRGVDYRLVAVVVWGLLWLVGPEGTPAEWESLRGQTVMVPFPNDMPDLVFQYLAAANGMTPGVDFEVEYYAQAPEIVGRLVSGAGEWAVLPEHATTLALAKAGQNNQSLGRVFDFQAEWAAVTGTSPRIPQAGIVVRGDLADDRPDVVAALLDELERAVGQVNAADPDTLAALSEASGLPAPMIGKIIPRLNLDVVAADEARPDLERFFTELAALSSEIIGGKLPESGFYFPDPR